MAATLALSAVLVGASPFLPAGHAAAAFKDVPEKHWASGSIQWATEHGIVSGYPNGVFKPEAPVQQAEFLAMLVHMYKSDLSTGGAKTWEQPFYDYAALMSWAPEGKRFDALKRGQAAQLLTQAAGYALSENEAIQYMLDKQLVKGKTAATLEGFDAKGALTRAEAVQMLRNFSQIYTEAKPAKAAVYMDYKQSGSNTVHAPGDSFVLLTTHYIGKGATIGCVSQSLNEANAIQLQQLNEEQTVTLTNGFSDGSISLSVDTNGESEALSFFYFKSSGVSPTSIKTPRFELPHLTSDDSRLPIICSEVAGYPHPFAAVVHKSDGETDNYRDFCEKDSGTVYLRHGAGAYEIYLYYLNDADQFLSDGSFLVTNNDTTDLDYVLPESDIESDNPEIIRLAAEITIGIADDYSKTKAIHDWVARNIGYDIEHGSPDTLQYADNSAKDVLKNRIAICTGYANLTVALNRAAGIQARFVAGIAGAAEIREALSKSPDNLWSAANHAWTEALVDGRWIIQDPTWDAGGVTEADPDTFIFRYSSKYFDPTEQTFAQDHLKVK
ncbi:transglutaminase domain-containing protein [Gorillibacterium massiliense]|uniref:transglutaminase domain-containing protein n=1 Tax=Gorillibacterium massiliense TaxID=1280390 RepID=UPI0012DC3365|nr:transglutaminase domain-containing protein [Gorillibacterium massiliense]